MSARSLQHQKGISLIEVLVGCAIAAILYMALSSYFGVLSTQSRSIAAKQAFSNALIQLRLWVIDRQSHRQGPCEQIKAPVPLLNDSSLLFYGVMPISLTSTGVEASYQLNLPATALADSVFWLTDDFCYEVIKVEGREWPMLNQNLSQYTYPITRAFIETSYALTNRTSHGCNTVYLKREHEKAQAWLANIRLEAKADHLAVHYGCTNFELQALVGL